MNYRDLQTLSFGLLQTADSKVFIGLGNGTVKDLTASGYVHPNAQQCTIPDVNDSTSGLMSPAMYRRLSTYSPEYQLIDENENYSGSNNGFKIGNDVGSVLVGLIDFGNSVSLSSYVFVKSTIKFTFTGYMTDPYAKTPSGYATFSIGSIQNDAGLFSVTLNWSGNQGWYERKSGTLEGTYFVKVQSSNTIVDTNDAFGDYNINLLYPFQVRAMTRNSQMLNNISIRLEYEGRYRIEGVPK